MIFFHASRLSSVLIVVSMYRNVVVPSIRQHLLTESRRNFLAFHRPSQPLPASCSNAMLFSVFRHGKQQTILVDRVTLDLLKPTSSHPVRVGAKNAHSHIPQIELNNA
jgi:hypothetical protein